MTGGSGTKKLCKLIYGLLLGAFLINCASMEEPRNRIRVDPSTLFNPNQDNDDKKNTTLGPLDTTAVALKMAEAEDAIVRGLNKQLRAKMQPNIEKSPLAIFTFYWAIADPYERWEAFNKYKIDHRTRVIGPLGVCLTYLEWRVVEHAQKPCDFVKDKYGNISIVEVAWGRYWEAKGDIAQALKHYSNAVEINGKDVSAHLAIGKIKAKKGESAAALKAWDRSIQAWPDCFRCHKAKAQYIEEKFGLADALPIWERVLEIAPEDTGSLTRYAKAQVGRNDDKALFAYETALKGGKKDFETYMAAAKICIRLSKVNKAITYLEAATELDKTNRDTWWSLTLQYEKGELEDKYIEALNKMLEFEPNNDDVHVRLAKKYRAKQEMVNALRHYDLVAGMYRKGGDAFLLSKAVRKQTIKDQESLLNDLKIGRGFTGGPGEVVGTVQYRSNKMFQQRVRVNDELSGAVSLLIETNAKSRVSGVTVKDDQLQDDWVVANIIGNFKRAIIWGGAKRYNIELVYEK